MHLQPSQSMLAHIKQFCHSAYSNYWLPSLHWSSLILTKYNNKSIFSLYCLVQVLPYLQLLQNILTWPYLFHPFHLFHPSLAEQGI